MGSARTSRRRFLQALGAAAASAAPVPVGASARPAPSAPAGAEGPGEDRRLLRIAYRKDPERTWDCLMEA